MLFKTWTALVLVGLLAACGGGGGGSAPPAAGNNTPTVLASAYVGTSISPGFWAVVQSSPTGNEFLAMNYIGDASSSVSTVLYSGNVQAGVNGQATASALRTMRADGTVRDGTASISGVTATDFAVSFDSLFSSEASSFSALATTPVDAAAGNWTGRWVDGLNSNTNLSLLWSVATASVTVASCNMQLTLGPWQAATGLYPVLVDYPANQTGCGRQNTQLKGWAFVQQTGTKQMLRFMAVDPNGSGSGISFSAER